MNGVSVKLNDGTVIKCKPLSLRGAMEIEPLWNERVNPDTPNQRKGELRLEIAHKFAALYPELVDRISLGDVDLLVPDFFWQLTGAHVPAPAEDPPTGSPSGGTSPPPGDGSPSPT